MGMEMGMGMGMGVGRGGFVTHGSTHGSTVRRDATPLPFLAENLMKSSMLPR